MTKLLDPKNDVVFQKLFGMKIHKKILISFLNSILNLKGINSIKEVEFEEKHLDVSLITSEKLSILDLHVTTEKDMHVNVEIQLVNQYNMIKRTIFYMSKMLLSQLKKGENYSDLNRTVTINILNFNYLEGESFIKCYGLFEKETKKPLTDLLELIFIELPKFKLFGEKHKSINENEEYNEKLYKWLTFLSNPTGKETDEFMKTDGEIKEAMDVLYKISGDKEAVMLAEMREKAMMDEQSRFNGGRREARREVLKETIIDNLKELGNVPQNLIDLINEQDNIDVLKSWIKIATRAESLEEFMKTDGEIKEAMDVLYKISGDKDAIMLAEMREKAMMDEQSRLNGARREALKEAIIDNLSELGNVPQNLIDLINEQDNIDVLKSWNKIAARAESLEEFGEKIK